MKGNRIIFFQCLIVFSLMFSIKNHPLFAQEHSTVCPKPYIKLIKPRTAKSGEKVIIRGHRFGKKKGKVIFAKGKEAKIIMWKNSRIIVIVPKGAKSGKVFVINKCGRESNREYFKVFKN